MLTVSQVAERFNISNRDVYNLVEQGYLYVSQLHRNKNNGISYLFSEKEIENLDIYSLLAEAKGSRSQNHKGYHSSFKQLIGTVRHYDRFLENVSSYPEANFIEACFYLFHLNHYAKTYQEKSSQLYKLKNEVLEKLYTENSSLINARYLTGPDRYRMWLCEDCKEAAHDAGISYTAYIKNESFCPKCSLHSVEKEYYTLIEFRIILGEFRFTFHLPLASASRWMKNLEDLPQDIRKTGKYNDRMYMYGRPVSTIEEKAFPIDMIIQKLKQYKATGSC